MINVTIITFDEDNDKVVNRNITNVSVKEGTTVRDILKQAKIEFDEKKHWIVLLIQRANQAYRINLDNKMIRSATIARALNTEETKVIL